jgi:hypothetical protein
MAKNEPYGSVGKVLQSEPRIIDNPPAATVAQALANAKAQTRKAK